VFEVRNWEGEESHAVQLRQLRERKDPGWANGGPWLGREEKSEKDPKKSQANWDGGKKDEKSQGAHITGRRGGGTWERGTAQRH